MPSADDPVDRLERLLSRRFPSRPDWLKAWRNEPQYVPCCARRAADDEDEALVDEPADEARALADAVEARLRAEGLCPGAGD